MVKHDICVKGVDLKGNAQTKPVLLQMNDDDFPTTFLRDLSAIGGTPLSSTVPLVTSPTSNVTLYQPVTRVLHLALVQLNCESPGYPRLDPTRVLSAGLVIRQIPTGGGAPSAAWPWMKNANGQTDWVNRAQSNADDDPDPAKRPQLYSGQPALDQMLVAQTLATAMTESTSPAFVAAPEVCNAANRTLVYALIPTASNEASTQQPPSVGQLDSTSLAAILPTLLKACNHGAPYPDQSVNYQFMSDDYATNNKASGFLPFSAALRMLYTSFNAFDSSPGAQALLNVLDEYSLHIQRGSRYEQKPMGQFYQEAAAKLIDFDPYPPNAPTPTPPELKMPHTWPSFNKNDQDKLFAVMLPRLQSQGQATSPPPGRFQDSTRLYRARLFFRIKGESSSCPPELVWSCYTDPFRIAAWYESSGRSVAPVPLPDPFDRNAIKSAKPTSSFAVPPSLANAMAGAALNGLTSGQAPSPGPSIGLGWICSFSIPLITICAFFVLNIFLSLLNIVFFWLAFIKICIPFPAPKNNG
jgi:hypothetical protein